jgi:hypothetical protein
MKTIPFNERTPSPIPDKDFLQDIAKRFNDHLGLKPPINTISKSPSLSYLKKQLHEAIDLCMTPYQYKKKYKC